MQRPGIAPAEPLKTALTAAIVVLVLLAFLALGSGEPSIAGVIFLLASIAIYLRETRTSAGKSGGG